jgi:hypothetical protein
MGDEIETRDTSWVQGVLAETFTHFPGSLRRIVRDGRYNLPADEDDLNETMAGIDDYMGFRSGKYNAQNLEFAIQSSACYQQQMNGIGVIINYANGNCYNFVIFDDGEIAQYDEADSIVSEQHIFDIEYGILVI